MSNYDLSGWHPACGAKLIVNFPDGLGVYCAKCGVVANLEAVAGKISPEDACKTVAEERKVVGDQSFNVNKGAVVK